MQRGPANVAIMLRLFLIALAMGVALPRAPLAAKEPEPTITQSRAFTDALRDMCGREVAVLGEPAGHGDARTIVFKSALVRALVDRCGFDAVLFEGSSYDFLELERRQRRGAPVTRAMLSSAIGGLWNRYEEMQPLITWLHERLAAGHLRLGGLDDQLGSAGAFYSISEMPAELTGSLTGARASACREELRRRIYGEVRAAPHERAPLLACITEIRAALGRTHGGSETAERLHMLDNVARYVARDSSDEASQMRQRDRSMWLNYRWLIRRLPRASKVILWGASVHLARDATRHPGFAGGGNLGAYIDRAYGRRAFFLGFSAASGTYRSGGTVRTLAAAQPNSLEQVSLRGSDGQQVYIGRERLQALGTIAGGVFAHEPVTADWSRIVDGLVVFREERAPELVRPPS